VDDEGSEVGVFRPGDSSKNLGAALVGAELVSTGVRALRNSVYATGGVMGVLSASSCLMMADKYGLALCRISEGNDAVLGVWSGGRVGFLVAAMLTTVPNVASSQRGPAMPTEEAVDSDGHCERNVEACRAGREG